MIFHIEAFSQRRSFRSTECHPGPAKFELARDADPGAATKMTLVIQNGEKPGWIM